ncbi:hypothetical protein ABL78_8431 [Leptomonas seymouri]|uniref:Uncharacterized protein n=1 Tax=Leptomonas seymouri TaxID=5684 RepID=A0A0N1HZ67_LEPSE|nr:hypothetical protein ABL78_8431 [Leptomonas seymouri]|eukprot:KPI82560.1 hypothetical protein ABL78_8431 [Leptomonas seymouri]
MRRAGQHRPPSLWRDVDSTRTGAAGTATATAAAGSRGQPKAANVPGPGEIAGACTAAARGAGANAADGERLVALQDEEIDATSTTALDPIQ